MGKKAVSMTTVDEELLWKIVRVTWANPALNSRGYVIGQLRKITQRSLYVCIEQIIAPFAYRYSDARIPRSTITDISLEDFHGYKVGDWSATTLNTERGKRPDYED